MKIIVVPVDFTDISLNAARYAADMATTLGMQLTLIHVCSLPVTYGEIPYPSVSMDELAGDSQSRMDQLKEELSDRSHATIQINTIVETGYIMWKIKEYCDRHHPFAIVMGSESADAFERFLFGGITYSAINVLSWPVLIVPANAQFSSIRKIGLACDYRQVQETLPLMDIKNFIRTLKAELHIVFINQEKMIAMDHDTVIESEKAEKLLGDLHPKLHMINNDDIEAGLLEFSEKNHLDLLLVIPRKHNLITKVLQHSLSRRLAKYAHLPVMSLHE